MLRSDRQTKPGLVALYDIRPGNGAGPFLQPRGPHGAALGGSFKLVMQAPKPAREMTQLLRMGTHKQIKAIQTQNTNLG